MSILKKDLIIENTKLKRKLEHNNESLKVSASRDKGNTTAISGLIQDKRDLRIELNRLKELYTASLIENKRLKSGLVCYKEVIVSFRMNEDI